MPASLLADWGNFYVITGSAAAGLTGLTFVVIALAADANRAMTAGLRAYVTPTIVHFGTVLAVAAFLSVPHASSDALAWGFGAIGTAGLVYGGVIIATIRGVSSKYSPVLEDWLWHVALPMVAYGSLLAAAFVTARSLSGSLYCVAAVSMLLLYVGIHNAWDVAVSISIRQPPEPPTPP